MTISMENPVFSIESLSTSIGEEITKGAGVGIIQDTFDVVEKKITLEHTPIAGSIRVWTSEGVEKPSASGKQVTVTTNDEMVKVFYKYKTSSKTERITITGKSFPKTRKMYLQTLVSNSNEEPVGYLQITLDRVKPNGDINMSLTSEKQANATSMTWNVMANKANELATIEIIPLDESEEMVAKFDAVK